MSFFGHLGTGRTADCDGDECCDWDEWDLSLSIIFCSNISFTVVLIILLPKNLFLNSSNVAIDNKMFSPTPANLDFKDFIISSFIVRIPWSSSQ